MTIKSFVKFSVLFCGMSEKIALICAEKEYVNEKSKDGYGRKVRRGWKKMKRRRLRIE